MSRLAQFAQTNAALPNGDLIQASNGTLYGTTRFGGLSATGYYDTNGTVFKVAINGELSILVRFNGTNGSVPQAGLAIGADGALYGTTSFGGTNNLGTVFRVTSSGDLTTLVAFTGLNGATPYAGLVRRADGAFYGSTIRGGSQNYGTIFRVTTNGALTTLVTFDGFTGAPIATLFEGYGGALYGAAGGGSHGGGSIFELSLAALMQPLIRVGNGWSVGLEGIPGDYYRLQRASALSGPWQPLTIINTGPDGTGQYLDSSASAAGFYRAVSP